MDKNDIELTDLAQNFELYNRTEGKSPSTIRWYNLALQQFQRFLEKSGRSAKLKELDETTVREFILFLQQKPKRQDNPYVPEQQDRLTAINIQTYIRAIRAFFSWLYMEGYTTTNRLNRLKPPKAPNKVVDVLTQEEISKVLNCIDINTAAGARDYAILILFLDTGLRCGELRNFELDDINIDGGYLKVMGKGSKERVVTFGAAT